MLVVVGLLGDGVHEVPAVRDLAAVVGQTILPGEDVFWPGGAHLRVGRGLGQAGHAAQAHGKGHRQHRHSEAVTVNILLALTVMKRMLDPLLP